MSYLFRIIFIMEISNKLQEKIGKEYGKGTSDLS